MRLKVNIKPYLETLKLNERHKPEGEKLKVPSITELAEVAGLHRNSYRRLAQDQTSEVNKDAVAKTIAELRRRGFNTEINDILIYTDD